MPKELLTPEMIELATTYAIRVVGVIVLLFIANIVASWTRRLTVRAFQRSKTDETLAKFFSNAVRYVVLVVAVIAVLGIFGIETTSFAAVLGAAGLAIGLAFQGSLSNLAAGVMLLAFRPFKVGDVITAAGSTGKVDEIEIFTTRLVTPDNQLVIIPNSAVFGGSIVNVTAFDTRRVGVNVGTDYGADLTATRDILEKVANGVEGKLEAPAPQVVLTALGTSSIDWNVRVWCATPDFFAVQERLTTQLKIALDDAGIGIPFPQTDVHLDENVVEALRGKAS